MRSLKWQIICFVALFLFATEWVFATTVTFSEDTTLSITVGATAVSLVIPAGSTADEVIVNISSVEITKGSDGHISINSPGRLNLENDHGLQTACDSDQSKLAITIATKVIITPTSASDHCAAALLGGGGGGGGGGGAPAPSPAPAPIPVPAPGEQPPAEEPPAEPPEEEELKFRDVPKTDKFIVPLVKLMLGKNVYKVPKSKIYGKNKITKGTFALQAALGVSDVDPGFEKYPGSLARIRKAAVKAWPDVAKNFPKGKVKRYDFYELLLVARGIGKLESKTTSDLKKACKDVKKPTRDMAKVYFAAKKFGFAGSYPKGACRLEMPFARKEAAKFAMKAHAIKAVETPDELAPAESTTPSPETTTPETLPAGDPTATQ